MDNSDFYGMTPDEVHALLATNADPAALKDIQSQRDFADKLRSNKPANGEMIGNTYVPNIAGQIGFVANQFAANRKDKKSDAAEKALYGNQADLMYKYERGRNQQSNRNPLNPDSNDYEQA